MLLRSKRQELEEEDTSTKAHQLINTAFSVHLNEGINAYTISYNIVTYCRK